MARKKKTGGEQLDLIETQPENAKKIIKQAKIYKSAQAARIEALAEEVAAKKALLDLIHEAGLQRMPDGKIRFTADGFTITVTPADDKIKVKDNSESEE